MPDAVVFDPRNAPSPQAMGIEWGSGGTSHILPAERERATFQVEAMTNILDGGADQTARRRWIMSSHEGEVSVSLVTATLLAL